MINTQGVGNTHQRSFRHTKISGLGFAIIKWKFYCRPCSSDVGPLQALVDELEFNAKIAEIDHPNLIGCRFRDEQFSKAIERGTIAILKNELKESLNEAYVTMGAINALISAAHNQLYALKADWGNNALERIRQVRPQIEKAKEELLKFLGQE